MSSEGGAPFQEHITELRRRVMYSAIAVLVTTVIAFVFHEQVLTLLMQPAQGFTDIPGGKPIYTDLTEFISTAMKASLLVGLFRRYALRSLSNCQVRLAGSEPI